MNGETKLSSWNGHHGSAGRTVNPVCNWFSFSSAREASTLFSISFFSLISSKDWRALNLKYAFKAKKASCLSRLDGKGGLVLILKMMNTDGLACSMVDFMLGSSTYMYSVQWAMNKTR
jgi:hypothetical protein